MYGANKKVSKMFNMFRHQGNTNQKYFEISFYLIQNNLNSNQTNDSNAAENMKKKNMYSLLVVV